MAEQTMEVGSVWLAWLATILLLAIIGYDIRRDPRRLISARNVVLIGMLVWYMVEALQAKPAVFAFGGAAYDYGVLLVMLAAASFLIGYHRSRARWFGRVAQRVAGLQDWTLLCHTLIVGTLLGVIPIVWYGLADPAETWRGLIAGRHGWRGTLSRPILGDFRASVLMLETFLLGVAWIAMLVLGDRRRTRRMGVLAACVLAWYLVRCYGTGTRWLVFVSLLTPAAWLYWRASRSLQRRLVIMALPCALLFYWFSAAMVAGRNEGRLDFSTKPDYVGHEMFRELLFIVDQVPSAHPHAYGRTLLVEAINPIPRFLWEGKPVGFGVEYARWKGESPLHGGPTLSPGIIGEMYVNFGLLGIVFLSGFGGVLCRAWDRIGPRVTESLPVLMFYSIGLGCFLMMGRSMSIHLFYQLFAALICLGIASARQRAVQGELLTFPWRTRATA